MVTAQAAQTGRRARIGALLLRKRYSALRGLRHGRLKRRGRDRSAIDRLVHRLRFGRVVELRSKYSVRRPRLELVPAEPGGAKRDRRQRRWILAELARPVLQLEGEAENELGWRIAR